MAGERVLPAPRFFFARRAAAQGLSFLGAANGRIKRKQQRPVELKPNDMEHRRFLFSNYFPPGNTTNQRGCGGVAGAPTRGTEGMLV
jgi:hypothetical protein